jgi:hypothetical protein
MGEEARRFHGLPNTPRHSKKATLVFNGPPLLLATDSAGKFVACFWWMKQDWSGKECVAGHLHV